MKKTIFFLAFVLIISITLSAQSERNGYILKPDEGEKLGSIRTIKASPKSGTQGGVMVIDKLPSGFETTFHVHEEADEFFYVISGDGTAEFDGKEQKISSGYVIFVPAGSEHNMKVSEDGPMELLFFFDKPGADQWFREAHEQYFSKPIPLTVEACNKLGKKYGYKCIDKSKD